MACCRLQRKPKLVREFFKDFFLLIIEGTEGKQAPGGTKSFSDCYRLTSDQMTGSLIQIRYLMLLVELIHIPLEF